MYNTEMKHLLSISFKKNSYKISLFHSFPASHLSVDPQNNSHKQSLYTVG